MTTALAALESESSSRRSSSLRLQTACVAEIVKAAIFRARVDTILHDFNLDLMTSFVPTLDAIRKFSLQQARDFSEAVVLALADFLTPIVDDGLVMSAGNNSSKAAVPPSFSPSLVESVSIGSLGASATDLRGVKCHDPLEQPANRAMSMSMSQCLLVQQTCELLKRLDEEGNKMINKYTVIDDLGRGAYGKVKLAVDEANCPVAIKIVRKSVLKPLQGKNGIAREIAVMKKVKHRNVVPLYEVIDDPESEKLYMVMKYVDQGPITKLRPDNTCDALPQERVKEVMAELVSGLSYLHKRGVAHRDIKPDNILVDGAGVPYFVDFGVSAIIDKDNPNVSTVEGTAAFMPPELFDESTLKVNAFVADVWSLGVSMYLLLYGVTPFRGSHFRDISLSVRNDELGFPATANDVAEHWQHLLRGMLCKDPLHRMSLKAVKKHPALLEDDVTFEDLERATSRFKNFLSVEEPRAGLGVSGLLRNSIAVVPRCARRSLAAAPYWRNVDAIDDSRANGESNRTEKTSADSPVNEISQLQKECDEPPMLVAEFCINSASDDDDSPIGLSITAQLRLEGPPSSSQLVLAPSPPHVPSQRKSRFRAEE